MVAPVNTIPLAKGRHVEKYRATCERLMTKEDPSPTPEKQKRKLKANTKKFMFFRSFFHIDEKQPSGAFLTYAS